MFDRFKFQMRRFRHGEEGSIIAETAIMIPTLFAATMATFVFFDAYRNQSINIKANYTIADSLSRESKYITNTFMVNTWNLHRFLTNSPSLTSIRVSLIEYDGDADSHTVVWSRAKGGGADYDDAPSTMIGLTTAEIPIMPNGEALIVVQTAVDYEPKFGIGLGNFTFRNTTYTRPRWAPNGICYSANGSNESEGAICPDSS